MPIFNVDIMKFSNDIAVLHHDSFFQVSIFFISFFARIKHSSPKSVTLLDLYACMGSFCLPPPQNVMQVVPNPHPCKHVHIHNLLTKICENLTGS